MTAVPSVAVPGDAELDAVPGAARGFWTSLVAALEARFEPLSREWRPMRARNARCCVFSRRRHRLLYVTPTKNELWIGVVLGDRAVAAALQSHRLPPAIKLLVAEAPRYPEGRVVRFLLNAPAEIRAVVTLLEFKTAA